MWTRVDLKTRSKAVMKRNYWNMFLVSLITSLFFGVISIYSNLDEYRFSYSFVASLGIISLIIKIFVYNPLECGKYRFYLLNIESNQKISTILYYFSHDYQNVVKIMFLTNLKIYLWTLLFIIPGIIKSLEYSMIPYIIAENSSISSKDVFERSKALTNGFKMDMFVLDLSFMGWMLLGIIVIVGLPFINPYIDGTIAELYVSLKEIEDKNNTFTDNNSFTEV